MRKFIEKMLYILFGIGAKGEQKAATKALITYWLVPRDDYQFTSSTLTYGLLLNLYKACDKAKVQAHVRKMDYPEFLHTPYWLIFSHYMKLNEQCEKCVSVRFLELHHKSYKHLGIEILYPSDMAVLCRTHHKQAHNK